MRAGNGAIQKSGALRKRISELFIRYVGQPPIFKQDARSRGWNETYLQIMLRHQCEEIYNALAPSKNLQPRLFSGRNEAQDMLRSFLMGLGLPFPSRENRETEKRIITMELIENDNVNTDNSATDSASASPTATSKKKARGKKKSTSKAKPAKKTAAKPSKPSKLLAKKKSSSKKAAKTDAGNRKSGVGAYVKELILAGKTREQTLALARKKFGDQVPDYYFAWYRRDLEKKGQLKPSKTAKKKTASKKVASKKKTSKKKKASKK